MNKEKMNQTRDNVSEWYQEIFRARNDVLKASEQGEEIMPKIHVLFKTLDDFEENLKAKIKAAGLVC